MKPFEYSRAQDARSAIRTASQNPHAKFIGGGTNLVDLMKYGVEQPTGLIDINRLPLSAIEALPEGGLRIGALARNSDMANHPLVRSNYPVLSDALLSGASAQLRNLATAGGNLMQRTRCYYFYDVGFTECNKRNPGSGCAARNGINRIHAILGASPQCIATNPGDMSVALAALEAVVLVDGPKGSRRIPIADFHRLPGNTPEIDTNLQQGELITAIELPPYPAAARHWNYTKVRDRASYAFALVSVAAVLDLDGNRIRGARIALGGVAHKPWRVPAAEQALVGKQPDEAAYRAAAALAVRDAVPYPHNAFKVELAQRAIVRALTNAASRA
ncbi:MAG: xanthine dehydrogenase family protein subunit M [Acidobacteriota bacterium]|nr:xanthine dehydrogenase family protein subunit M [Acidobacteriota bacterium]